ncbi:MAG: hypothetical protein EKK37_05115 [Sphingobacteriales bacterium]|nr:MAG: hypothetical protein EKK37_05115 [Sphingobacteriales bacterium]
MKVKIIIASIAIFTISSCGNNDSKKNNYVQTSKLNYDFIENPIQLQTRFVDSVIDNLLSRSAVEFIDMYPNTREIPEIDTLFLVFKLKHKNFKVLDSEIHNWSRGPKMISYWLESSTLQCRVDKLYHSDTTIKGTYSITERLGCLNKER